MLDLTIIQKREFFRKERPSGSCFQQGIEVYKTTHIYFRIYYTNFLPSETHNLNWVSSR